MPKDDEKMPALSIESFSPAKQEILNLVEFAKAVNVKDITKVHDARITLRDARISVTKRGKELREGALKFQKDVISKEKELIGLLEPEEERLNVIEDKAKLEKEMETRRDELPTRKAALDSIGDGLTAPDTELLAMDDDEFNAYRIRRIDAKLTRDRDEFEKAKREDEEKKRAEEMRLEQERREKLAKEEAELAAKRAVADAELAEERRKLDAEKQRIAAEEKAKRDAEDEKERELQRKEREAKLEADKKEAEAKRAAEAAADLEKAASYQKFLADNNYNEETDTIEWFEGECTLYRKVASYKPTQ